MYTPFTRSIICRLAITATLLLAATISLLACAAEPTPTEPQPTAELPISAETTTPASPQTPTTQPTPTPHPDPNLRYYDEKQYILERMNDERANVGAPPLVMGNNISAQIHAEQSLRDCHSSGWSLDGLRGIDRYTLAGGYQHNNLTTYGLDYCGKGEEQEEIARRELRDLVVDLFEGNGYFEELIKETLNDETYRKLNIGLASDEIRLWAALLLERDYIDYGQLPKIENGILTVSGSVKNGISLDNGKGLSAAISYSPPPQQITAGQVARVYSSDTGLRVAAIRRPAGEGYSWPTHEYTRKYNPCPRPYDIPADVPPPMSAGEASDLHDEAKAICFALETDKEGGTEITVPWITASQWDVEGDTFAVAADVSEVIKSHGNGLYTVVLWGELDGKDVSISEYVIFYGVIPPNTYYPK